MTIIGTAYVDVKPRTDARGFTSEAERGVLSPLRGIAAKASLIIGGAFAGTKVIGFFKDAVKGASNLSESMNKNRVVFGQASKQVEEFAKNAAKGLGQSQAQALEATGVFGNLLRAVGLTEDKAADFSVQMTKLASDLASFNNTSVDEALVALRSGLVGETEPLKRFGVNLNEAALKQKALALGLSDGKGVLDASAKAQAAYALIMEQTALAQGDFARTSGGLANQQKILNATWADTKTRIGTLLLPAINAAAATFLRVGVPAIESFVGVLERNLPRAAETAGQVVDKLTEVFERHRSVVEPAAVALGTFVGALGAVAAISKISGAISAAVSAISTIGPALLAVVGGPVTLIIAAVAAIAAGLIYAYTRFEGFRNAVDAVARTIRDVAVGAFNGFLDAMQAVGRFLQNSGIIGALADIGSGIKTGVGAVGDALGGIGNAAGKASGAVAKAFGPLIRFFEENVNPTVMAAAEFTDALIDRFVDLSRVAGDVLLPIMGTVGQVLGVVGGIVRDVFVAGFQVALPIIQGVLGVLDSAFRAFAEITVPIIATAFDGIAAVVDIAFGAIVAVIETVLGIIRGIFQVATGILRGDFGKIWEGLETIVMTPFRASRDFIVNTVEEIVGFLSTIPERVGQLFRATWNGAIDITRSVLSGLAGIIGGALDAGVTLITRLPGRIIGLVGVVGGAFASLGRAIIDGIFNGMKAAAGFVADVGRAIANAIIDFINEKVIDNFNNLLPNSLGAGPFSVNIPDNPVPRIPRAERGAVITRDAVYRGAEGNRPEAVVPLTGPAGRRAMELIAAAASSSTATAPMQATFQISVTMTGQTTPADAAAVGQVIGDEAAQAFEKRRMRQIAAMAGTS